MVASGAIQTIGVGLLTTFKVDTSTAKWVGYQLIGGFGRGLGFQMVPTSLSLSVLIIVSPRH